MTKQMKDVNKSLNNLKEKQQKEDKFLVNWAENETPEHFAGDKQTDEFTVANDYNENLDLRSSSPMGGPFMHPMHDATLDNYSNELDLPKTESPNEIK